MIISRTPFRVSFFGGGTDYPVWYREHGGAVLGTTIDKYCYITVREIPPFFEHRTRVVYAKIETVANNEDIEHPSVRECLRYLSVTAGLEIHHDGDLPARSGIGSSSAFTVGMLNALYGMAGVSRSHMELGLEAIHVEQDLIGEAVGSQDQILSALGGLNRIDFHPDGTIEPRPITLSSERQQQLEEHLLLVFTGQVRNAPDIAQRQIDETPRLTRELQTMHAMVDEATTLIASDTNLADFGELLHEHWMVKRSLTDLVSTTSFDEMYDAARSAGAIGGKLLGAGSGGFALFLAPPEAHQRILERLNHPMHVPAHMEFGGAQIVFFDPAEGLTAGGPPAP